MYLRMNGTSAITAHVAWPIALAILLSAAPARAQDLSSDPERRAVTAAELAPEERIVLDGRLDEPIWSRAIPATDFVQQDPMNGAPPTEATEVRFAFSRDALYMGVTCYDSEPDKMLGNTMKRDEFLRADDRFMWVFDPFLNGQGGYFFEMNPSGLMADSLMGPTGPVSREWDGIWEASTRRSEIGWTIEIWIPFRTLNFDPDAPAWGVNFQRTVRRKNEESLWTGWGYNQGLFRIQNSGLLLGIGDVVQGLGLDIRPYGVATSFASPGRGQAETKTEADAGIDVYYNITPSVRSNLTVNTDFAQTEVDQRQVNLTRFSLFFPEKRGFFLEGASFFDFISSSQGRFGGGARNDTAVVPFFSRRIGLDANGEPQKIDIGGKVTGQVGQQDIGFLYVRTGEEGDAVGENFAVARVKRRMLRQSFVGALFTQRDARAPGVDPFNTLGVDFRLATADFRGSQNLEATGYFLKTSGSDAGRSNAFGVSVDYPNDRYAAGFSFREIQENYDPEVGFTLRNGYRRYSPYFRFQPRPQNSRWVRQYSFGVDSELQFNTDGNETLLRSVDVTAIQVTLESQDTVEAHLLSTYERLDDPFSINSAITLPEGSDYTFNRVRLQASTANRRVIAVTGTLDLGEFYSGTRQTVGLNLAVRPRPGVVVYFDTERNGVDLAEGAFTTWLYRAVADTQFSPWIALTNNVQYDTRSRVMGWQSRFRWILAPGSDLYLVYNHNWLDDPVGDRFSTLDRRLSTKLLYTFGF